MAASLEASLEVGVEVDDFFNEEDQDHEEQDEPLPPPIDSLAPLTSPDNAEDFITLELKKEFDEGLQSTAGDKIGKIKEIADKLGISEERVKVCSTASVIIIK